MQNPAWRLFEGEKLASEVNKLKLKLQTTGTGMQLARRNVEMHDTNADVQKP